MITQYAIVNWQQFRCKRYYGTRGARGGMAVNMGVSNGYRGRRWHWSGSAPHHTRMWQYGQLDSAAKSDWQGVAALMDNDHYKTTQLPYSGANAYMIINHLRIMMGDGWSDFIPIGASPDHPILAVVNGFPQPAPLARVILTEP